jgi:hypothetical protein
MKYLPKNYFKEDTEYLIQITYKDQDIEYYHSTYK